MLNEKGLVSIHETTSLLNKEFLLRNTNFVPEQKSISVRPGVTQVVKIAKVESLSTFNSMLPIAMKSVMLGGENGIMFVERRGGIKFVWPESPNIVFDIKRRWFDHQELLTVRNNNDVATTVEIIEAANYIYILSPVRSWAIIKDGMVKIDRDYSTKSKPSGIITVDALDATILDLDQDTLKLRASDKTSSSIMRGTNICARMRSELGGSGACTPDSIIPRTNSYIAETSQTFTRQLLNSSETIETNVKHTAYTYLHSKDAVQQYSENDTVDTDVGNRMVVMKDIYCYGYPIYYDDAPTKIIIVLRVNGKDSRIPVGSKIGITIGRPNSSGKTWVDATVIDIPADYTGGAEDKALAIEYIRPAGAGTELDWGVDFTKITAPPNLTIVKLIFK